MKLSICMMVKNEERHLKQCLDSIQPLHKAMALELIIVDTGSTDATVEIARNYTDKVYYHEWDNDFAAMRNLTITYATGEWIFILDGDEVLNDCQNIIIFLKSKLNQEYNAAMLDVKNYVDIAKDIYSVLASPRLFKRGNIQYEGAVHNQPLYKGPVIKLNEVVLLHYGYLANDQELMDRKFKRTANLLIKQLEKEPENIYYRYQLSVSYLMHRDMEASLLEAEKIHQQMDKDRTLAAKHLYVYGHMAKLYGLKACYEDVERVAQEGLQINREYVDLWFYLHHSSIVLEKYPVGIEAGLEYIRLVENYNSLAISNESAIVMDNLNKTQTVIFGLAYSSMKQEQFEQALKYLDTLDADFEIDADFDVQVTKACFSTAQFQDLSLYGERYIDKGNPARIQRYIAGIEENQRKIMQEDHNKYLAFLEVFAQIEGSYGLLNDIRLAYTKDNGDLSSKLDEFVAQVNLNSAGDYVADIFYIMLNCGYPIADVLTLIREENINIYLGYLHKNYPDFMKQVKKYLAQEQDNDTYSLIRTQKILTEYVLEKDNSLDEEEYESYFIQYVHSGGEFLKLLYNSIIIEYELIDDLKNPEEVALLYFLKADSYKASNAGLAIEYLGKAREIFPVLTRGINLMIQSIEHPELKIQKEMESYKQKVKDSIMNYILAKQFDVAGNLIAEYLQIVPDDLDILGYKASMLMEQGEYSQAQSIFTKIIANNLENTEILLGLASCENRLGNHEAAVRAASLAKMLEPDDKVSLDFGKSSNDLCNSPYPRVLHGTMEIANQMHTLTAGLRDLGINAKSLCYYPNYLGYKADHVLDIGKYTNVREANLETKRLASRLIAEYDLFHFYFGTSLALDHSDLAVLKDLGKKIIMSHYGSDIRIASKATALNPYVKVKEMDEKKIENNLKYLAGYIDHCIVADYESYEYVKDYYKETHIIPVAIDLSKYMVAPNKKNPNKKLLIVHAPTSPEIKGTRHIIKIIERLKSNYNFEFKLIQGMAHAEAKKIYAQADIIIDQILGGGHGLLAVESMAMGKPVVCWISEFMQEKYPEDLPIISANPDTLEEKLKFLLDNREVLKELGNSGRQYVEKHHDVRAISRQLLELYNKI